MFKRPTRLWDDRRRHSMLAQAMPAHSNSNRSDRGLASSSQRARRQVLVCQWQLAPETGRPECHWQVEAIDGTSAEEPASHWGKGDRHRLAAACLLGKCCRLPATVLLYGHWRHDDLDRSN